MAGFHSDDTPEKVELRGQEQVRAARQGGEGLTKVGDRRKLGAR